MFVLAILQLLWAWGDALVYRPLGSWFTTDYIYPLRGMFQHYFHIIGPCACLAQFSLNNVQKGGIKQRHLI